jgi:hypothetical protein
MAMTRQLWSLSALSVELGKDRRTVAAVLGRVPADGTIPGGHRGWFLSTALEAFNSPAKVRGGGPLDHFAIRLDEWREVHACEPLHLPLDEAAAVFGIERETLVTWLRAGLPYGEVGDFETGDGFILNTAWLVDWMILFQCLARASGDTPSVRKLQIIA